MDRVNQFVKTFDSKVDKVLLQLTKPKIVRGVVFIVIQALLILYITQFAQMLPQPVIKLLNNDFFKLFLLSLVLWTAQFSPSISVMIALAFVVTVNQFTKGKIWEMMDNMTAAPAAPAASTQQEIPGVSSVATAGDAVNLAATVLKSQVENTPVVNGVSQSEQTITVTPTVINTTQGPVVVNPSVVIAPAVVATPSGETVKITPVVQSISVTESQPAPVVAPPAAETAAAAAAAAPAVVAAAPAAQPSQSECYPTRKIDMSKVEYSAEEDHDGFEDYAPFTKL